jgi:hypothetical protein
MPATLEDLKPAVDEMTDVERARLTSYLLDGQDGDTDENPPPTPLPRGDDWMAELNRDSDEIDAGTAVLTPWEEVRSRLESKLGVRFDD